MQNKMARDVLSRLGIKFLFFFPLELDVCTINPMLALGTISMTFQSSRVKLSFLTKFLQRRTLIEKPTEPFGPLRLGRKTKLNRSMEGSNVDEATTNKSADRSTLVRYSCLLPFS